MVNLSRTLSDIKSGVTKPIEQKGIVLPAAGVASGLIAGNFISETMARALGYIGTKKAVVKTGVKVALGGLLVGTAMGIPATSAVAYPAALGVFGLIPLDWIDAKFAGGITGLSERAAVVIRTWSIGVERVQNEIAQLEKLSANVIIETGGEVHFPFENTHTPAKTEILDAPLQMNGALPRSEPPLGMRLSKN